MALFDGSGNPHGYWLKWGCFQKRRFLGKVVKRTVRYQVRADLWENRP